MSVMINSTKNKFDRVVKTLGFIPFPYHSIRHHKNIYFIKFTGQKGEWKKAYTLKRRNTQSVERHRPKKWTNWNMKNAQTKEWYEKKTTPNALSYKHSHVHGWAWLNKQARTTQSKPCKRLIDNEWFWRNSELYLVRWWNISIKPPWYEINNTFVYISLFFLDFFFLLLVLLVMVLRLPSLFLIPLKCFTLCIHIKWNGGLHDVCLYTVKTQNRQAFVVGIRAQRFSQDIWPLNTQATYSLRICHMHTLEHRDRKRVLK